MTVADLINELQKLPPDQPVYYPSGEFKDDYQMVGRVEVVTLFGSTYIVLRY